MNNSDDLSDDHLVQSLSFLKMGSSILKMETDNKTDMIFLTDIYFKSSIKTQELKQHNGPSEPLLLFVSS